MTDLQDALDQRVSGLSEMPQTELDGLLHALERAYIHVLIEQQLRGAPR
jgi:hypothetical protein